MKRYKGDGMSTAMKTQKNFNEQYKYDIYYI